MNELPHCNVNLHLLHACKCVSQSASQSVDAIWHVQAATMMTAKKLWNTEKEVH